MKMKFIKSTVLVTVLVFSGLVQSVSAQQIVPPGCSVAKVQEVVSKMSAFGYSLDINSWSPTTDAWRYTFNFVNQDPAYPPKKRTACITLCTGIEPCACKLDVKDGDYSCPGVAQTAPSISPSGEILGGILVKNKVEFQQKLGVERGIQHK
jgi:hypothetical protein